MQLNDSELSKQAEKREAKRKQTPLLKKFWVNPSIKIALETPTGWQTTKLLTFCANFGMVIIWFCITLNIPHHQFHRFRRISILPFESIIRYCLFLLVSEDNSFRSIECMHVFFFNQILNKINALKYVE